MMNKWVRMGIVMLSSMLAIGMTTGCSTGVAPGGTGDTQDDGGKSDSGDNLNGDTADGGGNTGGDTSGGTDDPIDNGSDGSSGTDNGSNKAVVKTNIIVGLSGRIEAGDDLVVYGIGSDEDENAVFSRYNQPAGVHYIVPSESAADTETVTKIPKVPRSAVT
ncbi:MAG: hypothetical protein ACYTHJ_16775 [Planctomycetota bacterium]|jgi:hypothetical protein